MTQKRGGGGGGGGGGGIGITLRRYRSSLKRRSLSKPTAAAADDYGAQEGNGAGSGGDGSNGKLPTVKVTAASGDAEGGSGDRLVPPSSNGTTAQPVEEETAFRGDGGGSGDESGGSAPKAEDGAKNNGVALTPSAAGAAAANPSLLTVSSSPRDPSASFRLRRRRVQVKEGRMHFSRRQSLESDELAGDDFISKHFHGPSKFRPHFRNGGLHSCSHIN